MLSLFNKIYSHNYSLQMRSFISKCWVASCCFTMLFPVIHILIYFINTIVFSYLNGIIGNLATHTSTLASSVALYTTSPYSFAPVVITTNRGRNLTINIKIGHNKPLGQTTNIALFWRGQSSFVSRGEWFKDLIDFLAFFFFFIFLYHTFITFIRF